MLVTNASEALAWIDAWGGKPRPGVLKCAIAGTRTRLTIARSAPLRHGPQAIADDEAVLSLLQAALSRLEVP